MVPLLARGGALGLVPRAVQVLMAGSVGLGLLFVLLPAAGYLPALGARGFDFAPLRAALALPGLGQAVLVTAGSALLATILAVSLALGLVALFDPSGRGETTGARRFIAAALALVALPHLALAIGLAFLLAPSGWILRLAAALWPGLLVQGQPPDYLLVNDPAGLAMTLALVIKETPFVIAVTVSALRRLDVEGQRRVWQSLGYPPARGWFLILLPQVYRLIRLPVLAVLAYGLSVADLSIVLGPGLPPTLPVLILRLLVDPDLDHRLVASGAALLQLGLVAAAFLLWHLGEAALGQLWRHLTRGGRRAAAPVFAIAFRFVLSAAGMLGLLLGAFSALALLLWSLTTAWRFPDLWPAALTFRTWARALDGLALPLGTSLMLAGAATGLALLATIACLEFEDRIGARAGRRGQWVLYLPLFAPEMGFLFGLQVAVSALGLTGSVTAVLWFHLLFVLPYVFLTVSEGWRALDPRLAVTARCLGAGRLRVLLRVKIPLLRAPLAMAAAIGMTVSLSLYLPTVLAGAGRIVTLASEAVALYGGGDRRILGVYAMLQTLLALSLYLAALRIGRRRRFPALPDTRGTS
jgi:putative thiamine transport system permease protein